MNENVLTADETFITDNNFINEKIKNKILDSWLRCKKKGVDIYELNFDAFVNVNEIDNYLVQNSAEYHSNSALKKFDDAVKSLNLVVSIYNTSAKLQYIFNYHGNYNESYAKGFWFFKDVSEEKIGTNSTCISLIEKVPSMIIGPEHYNHRYHDYSCLSAPFFNEKNEIMGTVNISFPHKNINNYTLNLTYNLARFYEKLFINKNTKQKTNDKIYRPSSTAKHTFDDITQESHDTKKLIQRAKRIVDIDLPILIQGETGSGKELLAQSIHNASSRKNNPFITVNCGALPKDLIERELFGYEAGAFTTAKTKGKTGLIEYASGGTLFLDEVESMPIEVQIKLLRAISTSSINKIGGLTPISVNIKIISATNKDLYYESLRGRFREDLYYRLNVLKLDIPPLRQRRDDIIPIAEKYVKTISTKINIKDYFISNDFKQALLSYYWPGNVGELINVLQRSLVFSHNGFLDIDVLPIVIKNAYSKKIVKDEINRAYNTKDRPLSLLELTEELVIDRVLKEELFDISKAAKKLGISKSILYKKISHSTYLSELIHQNINPNEPLQ